MPFGGRKGSSYGPREQGAYAREFYTVGQDRLHAAVSAAHAMSEITGRTRLFAIVADPIGHVRTPQVFNARFAARGTDAVLVPFHVDAAGLPEAFRAFRAMKNLGGLIVTVPHKTAAVALCDAVGETGRAVGAVNTIRREPDGRLVADMFDGEGFLAGLRAEGMSRGAGASTSPAPAARRTPSPSRSRAPASPASPSRTAPRARRRSSWRGSASASPASTRPSETRAPQATTSS